MKSFFTFLLVLLSSSAGFSQLNYVWHQRFGGSGNDAARSLDVYEDGRMFITGIYEATGSNKEAYYTKTTQSGLAATNYSAGASGIDEGISTKFSKATGYVYVAGHFNGTVDFNPSPFIISYGTSANGKGLFFVVLDTYAVINLIHLQTIVPNNGSSVVTLNEMDIDTSGNIYLVGNMTGSITFNGGGGTKTASTYGDIFFAKYTPTGTCVWIKQLQCVNYPGSGNYISGNCIEIDNNGTIYIGGRIASQPFDVDPGPGTVGSYGMNGDIFVGRYSNNGDYLGHMRLNGSVNSNEVFGMEVIGKRLLLTGRYAWNNVDFDPGAATVTLPDAGFGGGVFTACYDTLFNYKWAAACNGNNTRYGWRITGDTMGNTYMAAMYLGTIELNPLGASTAFTSAGNYDIAVVKYDSSGNFKWGHSFGGTGLDDCYGIVLDKNADIFMLGTFTGSIDLDPSAATVTTNSNGGTDWFLARFSQSYPLSVKWLDIQAIQQANSIQVQWSVSEQKNCDHYEIESSFNGTDWTTIGNQKPQTGEEKNFQYAFNDYRTIDQLVYYRIKEVARDNTSTYSKAVSVQGRSLKTSIQLFPNPCTNTLTLNDLQHLPAMVRIVSACGQFIKQEIITDHTTIINTQMLQPGNYFLEITDTQSSFSFPFVKQ